MIPQRLTLSLSRIHAWLVGRASFRGRTTSCQAARPAYFRPQLAVLEERCQPSTTYLLYSPAGSSTAITQAAATANLTSISRDLADSYLQSSAGQQFVVLVSTDAVGNLSMWTGLLSTGGATNPIVISITSGPGQSAAQQPQGSLPGAPFIIIVPPLASEPPPSRPPTGSDSTHPNSWWSQTAHPGVGVLLVLPGATQTVSAVPSSQASTPVVLFLPQQAPIVGEMRLARPVADPEPAAFADALTSRASITPSESRRAIANKGMMQVRMPLYVEADLAVRGESDSPDVNPVATTASREALIALTQKILNDASAAPEEEIGPRLVLSLEAILACAAVQTLWLGLRQFATTKAHEVPVEQGRRRTWLRNRSNGLEQTVTDKTVG